MDTRECFAILDHSFQAIHENNISRWIIHSSVITKLFLDFVHGRDFKEACRAMDFVR